MSYSVVSRRLTGSEEAKLRECSTSLDHARDRLEAAILEVLEAGARVTDVAAVLGISRNAVYAARDRATTRREGRP